MRIITANVNGIRSAATKGFFDWFATQKADVLCLQEIKAMPEQLGDKVFRPQGYHPFFHSAEKKGYSGVAVYTKREPDEIVEKLGWEPFDREGRYLEARFGNTSVVSLYLPSGTSGPERQAFKYEVMRWLLERMHEWRATGRHVVLCGDWNIAHTQNDIKNWRSNQKNSGFLPEERAWLDQVFGHGGWLDAYRTVNPDKVEYTWWSNRGGAWANNVGWRIDYHVVTHTLKEALRGTAIFRDKKFSDHAPLAVDYDL
jgi:exodeoxyribonuclease III